MAKQKKKAGRASDPDSYDDEKVVSPKLELEKRPSLFPYLDKFFIQAIIVAIIGFAFYINTVHNEYALDDDIIVVKNQYVQAGFKGIKDIMSKDAFDSFYRQMQAANQLAGGRYRPLSIVTFAIEQQLFGDCYGVQMGQIRDSLSNTNLHLNGALISQLNKRLGDLESVSRDSNLAIAGIRHFVNVLLFVISMIVLLYLLRNYFFKTMPDLAFLTVLIFAIHPIHTEVIANVKSRDEIMSLLFICCTFIFVFRWQSDKKNSTLAIAAGFYFLALLSKEWGITLLALIPVALVLFKRKELGAAISATIPFLIVAIIYIGLRVKFTGTGASVGSGDKELLNNPYLLASGAEKFATKIFVLFKYLYLLVFPIQLSADYSYNVIHYRNLLSPGFLFSLLIYVLLVWLAFALFNKRDEERHKQRHVLSFALFFYLGNLLLVSNLVFNVGATMGERLIYHSSLGFAMALGWFLLYGREQYRGERSGKWLVIGVMLPLMAVFGFKCWERNAQWKNDRTLFITDAKTMPEAVMANGNAGKSFIEMSEDAERNKDSVSQFRYLDSAKFYLERSLKVHHGYYIGYLNMGFIAYKHRDYEKCEEYWNKAAAIFPRVNHEGYWRKYDEPLSQKFYALGNAAAMKKDFVTAEKYLGKAAAYGSWVSVYWSDYGGANMELKQYDKALQCFDRALQLDPNNGQARGGYKSLTGGKDWPAR
jgi:tetratricopeptide (TPR) repeat protein